MFFFEELKEIKWKEINKRKNEMNILIINEQFILFFMIANNSILKNIFKLSEKYLKFFQKQLLFVNNEK